MVIGRSNRLPTSTFLSSALFTSVVLSTFGASAKSPLDPAIGWDSGRIETGRAAAMAGANTAISSSVGALFSNPANMAANRIYHVGAFASIWPEAARQTYGAAVVDSSTSSTSLTGGLAAMWTQQDPDGTKRRGTDLVLGIAFPFSDKFRLGASLKYLSFRQQGNGPLGSSPVSAGLDGQPIMRDFGLDAGFTLQPTRYFSAGVTGINLNAPGHGFMPTLLTAGLGGGTEVFTLEADVLADFTTWDKTKLQYMGAGEILVAEKFPLRAGYRYDQGTKIQWLSAGAGYVERSMGIEVGLRRSVVGPTATAIVFSFTYHIESAGVGSTTSGNY